MYSLFREMNSYYCSSLGTCISSSENDITITMRKYGDRGYII